MVTAKAKILALYMNIENFTSEIRGNSNIIYLHENMVLYT